MPKKPIKYRNYLGKNGKFWWVCISRGGKKIERSTKCTDRSDAEAVRDELIRHLALAKFDLEVPNPLDNQVPTLLKAAKEWASTHSGVVSDRYIVQMVEAVELHFTNYRDVPLDQITTEIMEGARKKYLATQGRKTLHGVEVRVDHTIGGANRLIRLMSSLYGWAVKKRKYLPARPWDLSETKTQETPRAVVWPEQVQEFLRATDAHTNKRVIRMGIRMQIGLGLRESEAGGARWEWLSWRQEDYSPGDTKNRRTRKIPVPHWLLDLLRAEWIRQGRPTKGLILPDEEGDQKARGYTKNATREAGEDLGIFGLHPHRLRATFATAHWELGTPLSQIMLMMGHQKPATTLRYIETRAKAAAEAQAKVAAAMGF